MFSFYHATGLPSAAASHQHLRTCMDSAHPHAKATHSVRAGLREEAILIAARPAIHKAQRPDVSGTYCMECYRLASTARRQRQPRGFDVHEGVSEQPSSH